MGITARLPTGRGIGTLLIIVLCFKNR
jgi:chromosome segregation ATPase